MCVIRVPVADGFLRSLFRLIAETGILFMFAVFIYFRVNKWMGLFLALVIFSTIYPSFGKWSYMARGAVLVGCLWYVLIILLVKDTVHLLNALCIIALLNIIFANFQYCNLDPYRFFTLGLMKCTSVAPSGLMANKNILSGLLAMTLPAFFRGKWKWFVPDNLF